MASAGGHTGQSEAAGGGGGGGGGGGPAVQPEVVTADWSLNQS